MQSLSNLNIESTYVKDIRETLLLEYQLIIRPISETNHSFERALSLSVFGDEDETQSMCNTLKSYCDWYSRSTSVSHLSIVINEYICSRTNESSNNDDCYIRLAAEIYGISIHVHLNDSMKLFEIGCDCPIVHLIKVQLKDGSYIYLGTEKVHQNNENDDTMENDQQLSDVTIEDDEQNARFETRSRSQFQTICSLNIAVRKIKSDGNCFFRALSDQLCSSEEGHLVLRQLIMDYICENREKFEESIDEQHFSSWEDFTFKMRQPGTFADGTIAAASALSLRKVVVIHQESQRPVLFKPSACNVSCQQIHLAYDCKILHYDSLCSIDNNKLHIDDCECIIG